MSSTQKSTQKKQDKKQEGSRKQDYVIVEKTKTLPMQFYKDVIEAENLFISKPSCESCEKLLLLYKSAAEFYSKFDKENEKPKNGEDPTSFVKLYDISLPNSTWR